MEQPCGINMYYDRDRSVVYLCAALTVASEELLLAWMH